MAQSGNTLDDLIKLNQTSKTLQMVSKESLYSYVLKITDPHTEQVYAIKLIPMGYLPKTDSQPEMGSQQSQEVVSPSGKQKKTTPNPNRVEKEVSYLQKFEDIGPRIESYEIDEDYTSIIDQLLEVTQDEGTINTLNELKELLTNLKENNFQGVKLG